MSIFAAAPMASDWPPYRLGHQAGSEQEDIGLGLAYGRIQTSTVDSQNKSRPQLRTHKSFPHTLGTSNYAAPHCGSPLSQVANPGSEEETSGSGVKQEAKSTPVELTVQTTFGGSAPASPVPQLTPTSADGDNDDRLLEDDDDALMAEGEGATEEEGQGQSGTVEKTAAERRAEKRKMKRFRLTHNQTRFLMSEFARQAHPDAAQRERLSREIPGLSPRQVQVWFQNRRAKLKRLTNDDRERMMKSRALPEDFDMTQALHSPFSNALPHSYASHAYSTPMPSPASYASTYDTGMIRPLIVNGLRRESEDDSTISPVSMSSNFGSFYTPPGSVPTSENMSPISPSSERAPFMNTSFPQSSPGNSNPFSTRSSSFSSNFHGHPHIPRLQLHDKFNRSRAESLASPLRTSMSYTGNLDYATPSTEEHMPTSHSSSLSHPPRTFSLGEPSASQSAGFNFNQGFQSSLLSKPRPTITTFPPGLDLRSSYRPLLPFSSSFQTQHNQPPQQSPHSSLQSPHSSSLAHQMHASHQTATTTHSSLAYASSAPLAPPHDFSLPTSSDWTSSYDPEHENLSTGLPHMSGSNLGQNNNNLGQSSHLTSASQPNNNPLEPESYYKSEPEIRRHMSIASRSSGQNSTNHFSPNLGPQVHSPQGVKRRRDSGGEGGEGENEGYGGQRRRSFTLPGGYGS